MNEHVQGSPRPHRPAVRGSWLEVVLWVAMGVGLGLGVLVTHLWPKH